MPRFEFATAGRIIFGSGALADIGPIVAGMGRRALVVSGGSSLRVEALLAYLTTAGVKPIPFAVVGEPTPDTVRTGVQRARQLRCDVVIGCGGGSVLDTGKAVAALLTNGGDPLDYLAGSGPGQSLTQAAAPCIAIPTTAGTGAEVTPQAVLHLPEERRKVSLRSPLLLPRVALIDPELTHSLPPALTASTGLAALTQLIEPYVSPHATPPTDALALDGLHGRPARCGGPVRMAGILRRGKIWPWRVCTAGWPWPTPGRGLFTDWPGCWGACSRRRTGRFARPCCRR
jgi:alcohol dehydrogenase class IV